MIPNKHISKDIDQWSILGSPETTQQHMNFVFMMCSWLPILLPPVNIHRLKLSLLFFFQTNAAPPAIYRISMQMFFSLQWTCVLINQNELEINQNELEKNRKSKTYLIYFTYRTSELSLTCLKHAENTYCRLPLTQPSCRLSPGSGKGDAWHITSRGRDQTSKYEVCFLLNANRLPTIVNSPHRKLNQWKSGCMSLLLDSLFCSIG